VKEPEKDVLGTDEVVVQETGFLLGQHQDLAGTVGEALEHAPEDPTPATPSVPREPGEPSLGTMTPTRCILEVGQETGEEWLTTFTRFTTGYGHLRSHSSPQSSLVVLPAQVTDGVIPAFHACRRRRPGSGSRRSSC